MKTAAFVLLCLGLAAPAWAVRADLGQTPDQVRSALGRPDQTFVELSSGQDVEVWSYDKPYRFFWLGDCDHYQPQAVAGLTRETQTLGCRERARVIFLNGRVAAFLERD